ncbi:MAG: hypothetical protein QY318_03645 [Candidatus Dojkabacteria bacterium]|nr:MAG: hypothetical protein QY318_03645 [Candidatus Dojkabacteria bacterium]
MASKNKKSSQGSSASAQGSQSASASQSQGVEDTGRSVLSVMGWIIAGVFLLLFASFVFFENDESDELSQATQDKYDAVQELYDTVRPALSQEGQEDLDIVMEYIDEDPNRLNLEKDEHPAYVVEAYDAVKSEIEESVGSGQEPEEGVQVGDEYTVVGVLEETEEDTVYGPLVQSSRRNNWCRPLLCI